MKYDDYFKEVQCFSNCIMLVSGRFEKEKAFEMFKAHLGEEDSEGLTIDDLMTTRVRFGFPAENVENRDDFEGPVWYSGAYGKGSIETWYIEG